MATHDTSSDTRAGYCVDCHMGRHDKCDGALWASVNTPCTCDESAHTGRIIITKAQAIAAHHGHDLIEDSPLDDECEDTLWCNTCDVTVWYLESNIAP